MQDIYKNVKEHSLSRICNLLIVFDDMIAHMTGNKKYNPIVIELLREKTIFSHCFYYAILFCYIKKYYTKFYTLFCYEIPSKREFQKLPFNNLSDIDFTKFINIYKKCAAKQFSFLVIDNALASGSPLRFRQNLLERI